ncbi:MAG: STAS domain-containing protein [Nevskiaceae bacterium]
MRLELKQVRIADVVIVTVAGRVDHANADQFRAQLWPHLAGCAAGGDRLVLDLAGLEYVSSAGLRVLMLASRDVKGRDGTLVVCGLQPIVREIFEISRFNIVFHVLPDRTAALAELRVAAAAGA